MLIPLEQFVKQLEDSGILAGDTLKDFLPPKSAPKDAEELALELVRQQKLTKFQAEEVYRGNGKSLVLDNYILLEKIGEGGMGQVFKAEHRRMHRIVAVKVLPPSMMKNPATIARFQREVRAAARINHSNIVTAFDAGQDGGVHFLVMEHVEGTDLSALVKKSGPLQVDHAVNYILQTARGLKAAHAEGIVHRDIKPANLLLDKNGTVKILDMGLARLSDEGDSVKQAELTNTGTIMGTVDYMAPEQALNTKSADGRADIYSLGCSLFYLLTGKATYGGDTLMAKLLAHREQPIPTLRNSRPEVSEEVEMVFNKMVAKNVEDRSQTMTEVIADLEMVSTGQAAAFNTQQLFGSSADADLTNFLKDISAAPVLSKKSAASNNGKKFVLIGCGVLGVILLAGLVISLKSKIESEAKKSITAKLEPMNAQPELAGTKKPLAFEAPGIQKWMKQVAAMPAEEQVEAVIKKLKKLNFFYDGKETHKIENGVVTYFLVSTPFVSDISPVRALTGLKGLAFWDTKVSDLSPLKGMPLRELMCGATQVSDLSPLNGMPLEQLDFHQTPVSDLSPLKGMRLNNLNCWGTKVSDLSPLKGMPLVVVSCGGTQVSDLSPLKGMPLIDLGCDFKPELDTEWIRSIKTLVSINGKPVDEFWKEVEAGLGEKKATINTPNDPAFKKWVKQVATLSADKQVEAVARKLKELNPGFDGKVTSKIDFLVVTEVQFFADRVTDISPVRALPGLKTLNCSGTYDGEWNDKWKLADLSPLRGMSLTALLFSFSKVSDLSPLTGMPLTQLQFQWTQVTDLSPLNGMRLTTIVCGGTGVSDLSPLKGMPLSTIDFRGTKVSDLSPLKGMPLTMLFCNGTLVTDLTVLKDMPLNYLWLDFKPERDTEILRSIKTLETINDKPAAEFWKEVEEKKAEKKQ